ncbi:MAG: energy transducer TonB [Bacteroidia bacterium]
MKKTVVFIATALMLFGLTAFGFVEIMGDSQVSEKICKEHYSEALQLGPYPDREFVYRVANRFNTTLTLDQVASAKTVLDFMPKDDPNLAFLSAHKIVKLDTLPNNNNKTAIINDSEKLNSRQKTMLNDMTVSSSFYFESYCKINRSESGYAEDYHLVYHLSVVPQTQAQYSLGLDSLYSYLSLKNLKYMPLIDWERLWPGKVAFSINKKGEVTRVVTEMASGQKNIDANMVDHIKNMPGTWTPAKNKNGQPVKQEFVLFYGLEGC